MEHLVPQSFEALQAEWDDLVPDAFRSAGAS